MSDITRKILSRGLKDTNPQTYVGREGEVFYNPENLELRASDGSTPGGTAVGFGSDININTTGIITASAFYGNIVGSIAEAVYAETAGIATYAETAGTASIANYSEISGISTQASTADVAIYAEVAGIATSASTADVATYAEVAGIATQASTADVATYASTAGVSTVAQGLTGTPDVVAGIVTASSFVGDGSGLTGLIGVGSGIEVEDDASPVGTAATINFGSNLNVTFDSGVATIDAVGGGGGGESYWVSTTAGIHTTSNVGIGTTNPQYKLDVGGDINFTGTLYQNGTPFSGGGGGAFSYCCTNNITSTCLTSHPDITTGSNNFFAGVGAGCSITSGTNNNFFGLFAGRRNTTGCDNNFFGFYAGRFNTTGSYNNIFGVGAGYFNTTGSSNNFLGCYAGLFNTTGSYNNFFGSNAGRFNTTGSYNNFFGSGAGFFNTTGFNNNFLGINAGRSNTTGCYNTFLGAYSGGISTSASNKIILGRGNGYNESFDSPDTTKDTQFAVGVRTDSNPSKYWLVGNENFDVGIGTTNPQYKLDVGGIVRADSFVGDGSGLVGVIGTGSGVEIQDDGSPVGTAATINFGNNISVSFAGGVATVNGAQSGAFSYCCTNNITSTDLTSHPDITSASHNFFAGVDAGCSITSGSYNNFLGNFAGHCNTTGSYNNFFGLYAGGFNTTGCDNNFFGEYAGYFNTTGRYNNFLGNVAGRDNTTGQYNNFFGSFTGISTSASYKVVLGSGSNGGNPFDSPDTTKSTQFAVGVRTDANPSKYWLVGDENFNVGIGTTNPQYKLDVGGDINLTGTVYRNGSPIAIGRTTITQTTGTLGIGSTANITFSNGIPKYALLKASVSDGAWVTLYTDTASRTSDASRSIDTDPTPGSGVIAELIATGTGITTQRFTPGVIGYNDDEPVSNNIYAKVYNNSGISTNITVTLTISE